jgi:hypothetical protein
VAVVRTCASYVGLCVNLSGRQPVRFRRESCTNKSAQTSSFWSLGLSASSCFSACPSTFCCFEAECNEPTPAQPQPHQLRKKSTRLDTCAPTSLHNPPKTGAKNRLVCTCSPFPRTFSMSGAPVRLRAESFRPSHPFSIAFLSLLQFVPTCSRWIMFNAISLRFS